MADDVLGQVRSFTDPEYRAQFEQLTKRIATDQQFRDRLAKQPSQTLADFGIKIPSGAKFGERDQLLVRMIGDERIGDMYRAGRIEELQKYLVDNYGKIKNPSGPVESAAVIVDPAERFRAMEEMTGVQNARIAALEARIRMLEGRIG
jgi:hypothetical protein